MTFQYDSEEYVQNLMQYAALDETEFSPKEGKEEVIGKLKEISQKKKALADRQNRILLEYIERFEKGGEKLDADAAEKLHAFLKNIMDPEARYCMDAAIGLRLCRLLYAYYHTAADMEKTVYVIRCGATCEMMLSLELEDHDFLQFPQLCEEYFPAFEQLSADAQIWLMNAYSFRYVVKTTEGMRSVPALFPVIRKKIEFCKGLAKNQEYAAKCYFQLFINFVGILILMFRQDAENKKHGKEQVYHLDIEHYRDLMEDILKVIMEGKERFPLPPMGLVAVENHLLSLRYYLGELSFERFLDSLEELGRSDESAGAGGVLLISASAFYLDYLYSCSPYSAEEDAALARKKIDEVMPKILEIKRQKQVQFASIVLIFLNATSRFSSFSDFYDIVLAFTVYADKALYVHTVMVKEICHLLLTKTLKEKPEFLAGVCNYAPNDIKGHEEALLALMDKCAMCHDIGKHFLIEIVSNSSRRLTDDEFDMIKTHPKNFETVYENRLDETAELKCIRDCALLHHRWHNGEGGYPELPQTENRPFVDILAIADSLDAATDFIGRPYGKGKTLDDLIGEFLEMGGTRYSREVAEILNEPEVKAAVLDVITRRREEVNYQIYALGSIEK